MAKGQTLPEMSVEEEMRFAQLALNKMLEGVTTLSEVFRVSTSDSV